MDEKYDFLGIFKDDPHRLGFSICSSLAHKVLLRSQLVDADTLPGSRNLLPGELFVGLERCGWIEVGYDKYFDDHISELIPISPIFVSEQRRKYRAIMRSFLPSLVSIQEMAKNAGVTRRDLLRVECMLTNQHIFVVLAKEMARLFGQRVHIESREGVPAKHWAEENIAVKEWKQRLVQNQIEVREFVEASYEICKEISDIPDNRNVVDPIKEAIEKLNQGVSDAASEFESVLRNWSQAELDFALISGCQSWNLPLEQPKVDWFSVCGEHYTVSSSCAEVQCQLQESFDTLWNETLTVVEYLRGGRATSKALVGESEMEKMLSAISGGLESVRKDYQSRTTARLKHS